MTRTTVVALVAAVALVAVGAFVATELFDPGEDVQMGTRAEFDAEFERATALVDRGRAAIGEELEFDPPRVVEGGCGNMDTELREVSIEYVARDAPPEALDGALERVADAWGVDRDRVQERDGGASVLFHNDGPIATSAFISPTGQFVGVSATTGCHPAELSPLVEEQRP